MKALQFGKFFPPDMGGIESFIFDLTEELSQKIKCDVLCSNSKNKTVIEKKKNYTIIRTASFGKVFSTSISPAMIYWLKKIGNRYDVIHLHLPDPMANFAYFLVRPRTKLILHWHGDIVKSKYLVKPYLPLLSWLFEKSDYVISSSKSYALSSIYLKPFLKKVKIIPIGINPSLYKVDELVSQQIKLKYKDKKIILTVGRLVKWKGFKYAIESMKDVDDAVLLIIGDGPERKNLENLIGYLNLNKKVFLLGKLEKEKIASFLNVCDLFIFPSVGRQESFGIVQIEAMYFGKPIVSTNIKGCDVSWVNQNNITGIIVPPKDSKALAEAINKVIKNPEFKKRFGKNAKQRFEKEFDMKIIADKILKLYKEILENSTNLVK